MKLGDAGRPHSVMKCATGTTSGTEMTSLGQETFGKTALHSFVRGKTLSEQWVLSISVAHRV